MMTQKEFNRMVRNSKIIIDRVTKELVEMKLNPFSSPEQIKEKERELENSFDCYKNNYLEYYGIVVDRK